MHGPTRTCSSDRGMTGFRGKLAGCGAGMTDGCGVWRACLGPVHASRRHCPSDIVRLWWRKGGGSNVTAGTVPLPHRLVDCSLAFVCTKGVAGVGSTTLSWSSHLNNC